MLIGFLDADCFYVSCERARLPHLMGQPVGVLSNQGACVIAKSYELKARGISTGMPIWKARPLCPEAVFVKRDFAWYEILSRRMADEVRQVSPAVEYYSIDELFFDASWLSRTFEAPLSEAAMRLRERIHSRVGVPVSVGVSRSRTLAKLAAKSVKPFGCRVLLDPEETKSFLHDCPVEEIAGIGWRSADKLHARQIRTVGNFAATDRHVICKLLTKKGEALWWELHGEPVLPLDTIRPPHKMVGRGGSLSGPTRDIERLRAWLVRNVERLVEALDRHGVVCETFSLSLRLESGHYIGDGTTLPEATAQFPRLLAAARDIFNRVYRSGDTVTHMHLNTERLSFRHAVQQSLLDRPSAQDIETARLKRLINKRVGRFAVRSGATLPLHDIYADPTNGHDICDIYGKLCF